MSKKQLIECVPNFSEGRDLSIIKQITDEIESVDGVKLLDVDPPNLSLKLPSSLFKKQVKLST